MEGKRRTAEEWAEREADSLYGIGGAGAGGEVGS